MNMNVTLSGKLYTLTNKDAVGYDVWRNIGTFDSRTGKAKYFNGSWYKDVTDDNGKVIVFTDKDAAFKAILARYTKAKNDKVKKDE